MATYKKVSPKELVALGFSRKAEQFRNLETGELLPKRQYQKARQIGQYNAPEKKDPKKQHPRKVKPKNTYTRHGATVKTYVVTETKARQLIRENPGKLGTIGVPLKLNNKMGYAPSAGMSQSNPHYSDTMNISEKHFDRLLDMLGNNRKVTAKFLVTVYE